jgi:methionyl-tRNA formyltransferase
MDNNRMLFVTIKDWNIREFNYFKADHHEFECQIISDPKEFTLKAVEDFDPRYIFVPHWSWMIPEEIWSKYECVVFHATDLPFGRGGSPIQNLISRGIKETKISALRVDDGIDTGPIYMKRDLKLDGSAKDIFHNAAHKIFRYMIPAIIEQQMEPIPQKGIVFNFNRRTPEQGSIKDLTDISQVYDYIRMLDAEGYPNAFLETDNFVIEFSCAHKIQQKIFANVTIKKKENKS